MNPNHANPLAISRFDDESDSDGEAAADDEPDVRALHGCLASPAAVPVGDTMQG